MAMSVTVDIGERTTIEIKTVWTLQQQIGGSDLQIAFNDIQMMLGIVLNRSG